MSISFSSVDNLVDLHPSKFTEVQFNAFDATNLLGRTIIQMISQHITSATAQNGKATASHCTKVMPLTFTAIAF